jgi:hypothetical protein
MSVMTGIFIPWPLTAEAKLRFRTSLSEIYDVQRDSVRRVFLQVLRLYLVLFPPVLHTHLHLRTLHARKDSGEVWVPSNLTVLLRISVELWTEDY